ncbi:MAG: hypothetical protein PVJ57_01950 [Phycisphaerae bacterium]|jgi:hypothetical protein
MSRCIVIALLTSFVVASPAAAQFAGDSVPATYMVAADDLSPLRLLAGVRAYPDAALRTLLALADRPDLLRQLAEHPELIAQPDQISPPVPMDLQAAIRDMQRFPEAVALAAAYPEELATLRRIYAEAPDGLAARLAELRAAYDAAALDGARAWEQMLSSDPGAAAAYRDAVTRFCRAEIEQYPGFPCVQVTRPEYYYACPPNELLMGYVADSANASGLAALMERWWAEHGSEQVDARVQAMGGRALSYPPAGTCLAGLDVSQRITMWQLPATEQPSGDLVPIIMQPPADQPLDARLAFAVAEHARLWAPQSLPAEAVEPAPVAQVEPAPVLSPAPAPIEPDPGFVPWTEVVDAEPQMYGDPDYDPGYTVVYRDVSPSPTYVNYGTGSYRLHYATCYPYYSGYVWTWPLISTGPCWPATGPRHGIHYGCGSRAHVSYRGSHARVQFSIGTSGPLLYYDAPYRTLSERYARHAAHRVGRRPVRSRIYYPSHDRSYSGHRTWGTPSHRSDGGRRDMGRSGHSPWSRGGSDIIRPSASPRPDHGTRVGGTTRGASDRRTTYVRPPTQSRTSGTRPSYQRPPTQSRTSGTHPSYRRSPTQSRTSGTRPSYQRPPTRSRTSGTRPSVQRSPTRSRTSGTRPSIQRPPSRTSQRSGNQMSGSRRSSGVSRQSSVRPSSRTNRTSRSGSVSRSPSSRSSQPRAVRPTTTQRRSSSKPRSSTTRPQSTRRDSRSRP